MSDWLDFEFGTEGRSDHLDSELKGVDFVDADPELESAWIKFWPRTWQCAELGRRWPSGVEIRR